MIHSNCLAIKYVRHIVYKIISNWASQLVEFAYEILQCTVNKCTIYAENDRLGSHNLSHPLKLPCCNPSDPLLRTKDSKEVSKEA